MRILFFGDYSNVHNTLADEMRKLGHEVNVASDGDAWKNYKRDIDINYQSKFKFLMFLIKMILDKRFRGNDVVQIINYRFLFKNKLGSFNKYVFDFLKRNNKKVILCAYGDDYFVVEGHKNHKLKYSPVSVLDSEIPYMQEIFEVHHSDLAKKLNTYIADNSDGIVSCMYDYYVCYKDLYPQKLKNIPLPIDLEKIKYSDNVVKDKINIFFGLQKSRIEWKGGDIILKVLNEIKEKYPEKVDVKLVENVPYEEYIKMFTESNLFFDQTYLYSQGMNGLLALAAGKVLFGGGEPENYELNNEKENFPIVNITADEEDIKTKIIHFIQHPEEMLDIGRNSHRYILQHHDSVKIAKDYLEYYQSV